MFTIRELLIIEIGWQNNDKVNNIDASQMKRFKSNEHVLVVQSIEQSMDQSMDHSMDQSMNRSMEQCSASNVQRFQQNPFHERKSQLIWNSFELNRAFAGITAWEPNNHVRFYTQSFSTVSTVGRSYRMYYTLVTVLIKL